MEFLKPYAGSLQYIPQLDLSKDEIQRLRKKLVEKGVVQETENPHVMIDWYKVERNANRTPVRQSSIVLLRDGGDAGKPGCIFYRKEIDRLKLVTKELYHIPSADRQEALVNAWRWWEDITGQKLQLLNQYLDQIADTPNAWQPL